MGMAASQARLLCITARIHDVEFQAQSIQNAKLQLATQSDQVYQEYVDALDAQSLILRTVDPNSGIQSSVAATFNNLCSRNKLTPSAGNFSYALRDARGRLIVEDEIATGYADYKSNATTQNAQAFALFMLYGDEGLGTTVIDRNVNAAEEKFYDGTDTTLKSRHDELLGLTGGTDIYNESVVSAENKEKYQNLMSRYREELYKKQGYKITSELLTKGGTLPITEDEYEKNMSLFSYYVSMYNQIEANGGACISISQFNGFNGSAANDSDWLTAMVECGQISIEKIETDKDGGIFFKPTSSSSDENIGLKETSSVDNTVLKKAEAKYEHDLKEIQRKDKRYDLSLSKLESEREALTKERESLTKVIKDNIDRSFGIFS